MSIALHEFTRKRPHNLDGQEIRYTYNTNNDMRKSATDLRDDERSYSREQIPTDTKPQKEGVCQEFSVLFAE